MNRSVLRILSVLVALAVVMAACGDDADESVVDDVPSASDSDDGDTDAPFGDDAAEDQGDPTEASSADLEAARFFNVASGVVDGGTYGPECASPEERIGPSPFQITVPSDWMPSGLSDNLDSSQIGFIRPGESTAGLQVDMQVNQGADPRDGEAVGTVKLPHQEVPLLDLSGDGTVYGIDFDFADSSDDRFPAEAQVTISTIDPLDASVATELFESLRLQRCVLGRFAQLLTVIGVVPEIVDDPLGKELPSLVVTDAVEGSPFLLGELGLDLFTYLLPFEAPLDACVADNVVAVFLETEDVLAETRAFEVADVPEEFHAGC